METMKAVEIIYNLADEAGRVMAVRPMLVFKCDEMVYVAFVKDFESEGSDDLIYFRLGENDEGEEIYILIADEELDAVEEEYFRLNRTKNKETDRLFARLGSLKYQVQ